MATVPQERSSPPNIRPPSPDGERIVISGISGLYPESRSVKDLADVLYNKVNPIDNESLCYNFKHPEVVQYAGSIPNVERFDAQFFRVHYHLATSMDPMSRKILEQAYQAIYDAGVNPGCLSGKKLGVYVGSCFSETDKAFYYHKSRTGFGIAGCSKSKFANRISYWLNAKGPSMAIDEACCSSTAALDQAFQAMTRGECEAAVVAGSLLCLHPQPSVHFARILKLCSDGKTKAFSENADGCAKSEAINVLFLQKAKDAFRIYADIVHIKCEYIGMANDGKGPKYGFYREPGATINFLKKFYEEAKVPPQTVEYVEAVGSAIPEIDKTELNNIDDIFCKNKDMTLLVGSVMSNIGYNEAASGITAITKVLLGYHTGELAANLHCERLRQDVACLREGRVRIVTEHQPWDRGYVAINGMSVTGVNSHVLLHGHYKPKDIYRYKTTIPYLVPISARQDSAVKNIIDYLKSRPIDPEELALLHNIHQFNTPGHLGRGYVILGNDAGQKTVSLGERFGKFDDARRPLWFVYSGMGSQWPTMGAQLMRIPVFAEAIQRCHKVLQPKGINIFDIITVPDKKIFDNILHSFVGIAAVQIGLTDILKAIGLVPDGIIGHSVGELGCAYADGCMTAEEMILSAYYRGLVSVQTPFIRGSMAAVGMGYSQMIEICPPEIDVACHNGPDSCTISGPIVAMKVFVAELVAKGLFAKEVPCSNIAYHSRYIADAVLFDETSQLIPSNAILVEVAPHGLLQAILKRSLSPECLSIAITRRNHPDNILMLLHSVGTLYTKGYSVKVQNLYPKVEFPVLTGTPMLSHLVEWAHIEYWPILMYSTGERKHSGCCKYVISLFDTEHDYLRGNKIGGNTLYPFAAALVSVWDTLAMVKGLAKKQFSVQFRDVYFYSQPILDERRQLSLFVVVHKASGNFEVSDDNNSIIVRGFITPVNTNITNTRNSVKFNDKSDRALQSAKIYERFEDRGYSYRDKFRSIVNVSSNLAQAELSRHNWVTLIDGMLQLNCLRQSHSYVSVPASIRSLGIDVEEYKALEKFNEKFINIEHHELHDFTRGGGVLMETVLFRNLPTMYRHEVWIESLSYWSGNSQLSKCEKQGLNSQMSNVKLVIKNIGDYNSLHWVEAPIPTAPQAVIVEVKYAGISNSDFKKANGVIPLRCESDNAFGMDFSGVTKSGERVMGIVPKGACSNQIQVNSDLLWPVPAHWTLEDAATVPFPYLHALYLLVFKGQILPSMSVLVHGGAGALGQAAISVALAYNCTVFTTVSDTRKKRFLLRLFPQLKDEYIGNSRDATFKNTVLFATNGEGCDIVLSSIKGALKENNFQCCAFMGTVIDTNQLQDHEHFNYHLAAMFNQIWYSVTDFSDFMLNGDKRELKELRLMLTKGIASGYIRPLTRVTFEAHEAPRAFRLLADSAHRGRVLLDLKGDVAKILQVHRRIACNAELYQLIISNDSFGLHVAERLIQRGAKRIHLNLKTEFVALIQPKVESWKSEGLDVLVTTVDLDSVEKYIVLFNSTKSPDQIEGLYVADIHKEEIISSLDKFTRNLCPNLKCFTVINSHGNIGQNVCVARQQRSLPATMLLLSSPDEGIWRSKNEWDNFAVDAMERTTCIHGVAFAARPLKAPEKTLLQEIVQITGLLINDSTSADTTLKDFGLEDSNLNLISSLLQNKYNIYYDKDYLLELTIERIEALDSVLRPPDFEQLEGLSQFISYVDPDELRATTDMVLLQTLVSGSLVGDSDIDPAKKYLFIVPGLEGLHDRFGVLCERLKLPALVMQPGLDHPSETLQELAKRYTEVLFKKAGLNGYFYILGYESGVAVALEIAEILEDHGLNGTIFCLGCTPNELQETLKKELKKFNTEDAVLYHMFKLMTGDDTKKVEKASKNMLTWNDKIEACLRTISKKISYSVQYARELIETTLARIVQVQKYKNTERKLRSRIVYLRAAGYSDLGTEELQKYSEVPLIVHQLSAPLTHAASDLQCARIINDCLSSEILEEYDNGNLCESYLINSGGVMVDGDDE